MVRKITQLFLLLTNKTAPEFAKGITHRVQRSQRKVNTDEYRTVNPGAADLPPSVLNHDIDKFVFHHNYFFNLMAVNELLDAIIG